LQGITSCEDKMLREQYELNEVNKKNTLYHHNLDSGFALV